MPHNLTSMLDSAVAWEGWEGSVDWEEWGATLEWVGWAVWEVWAVWAEWDTLASVGWELVWVYLGQLELPQPLPTIKSSTRASCSNWPVWAS